MLICFGLIIVFLTPALCNRKPFHWHAFARVCYIQVYCFWCGKYRVHWPEFFAIFYELLISKICRKKCIVDQNQEKLRKIDLQVQTFVRLESVIVLHTAFVKSSVDRQTKNNLRALELKRPLVSIADLNADWCRRLCVPEALDLPDIPKYLPYLIKHACSTS